MYLQKARDRTRHLPLWVFILITTGLTLAAIVAIGVATAVNSTHNLSKTVSAPLPTTTVVQNQYTPNGQTTVLAWITALTGVVMALCAITTIGWGVYTEKGRRLARRVA